MSQILKLRVRPLYQETQFIKSSKKRGQDPLDQKVSVYHGILIKLSKERVFNKDAPGYQSPKSNELADCNQNFLFIFLQILPKDKASVELGFPMKIEILISIQLFNLNLISVS